MRPDDHLEMRFERRVRSGAMCPAVSISDQGLIFGAGTVLMRMTRDKFGTSSLAIDDDKNRMFALLSVVYKRVVSDAALLPFRAVSDDWRQGDKALASIRLAQAHLPRLDNIADAYRLFLAETLLDQGMAPRALMKALGLDSSSLDLIKYDPDQPRVPAGIGRESGQWTSGDSGSASSNQEASVTISEVNPKASTTAPVAMGGCGRGYIAGWHACGRSIRGG